MKKLLLLPLAALFLVCSCTTKEQKDQDTFKSVSKEVKAQFAPDSRDKTYSVEMKNVDGKYVLYGSTTEKEAKEELVRLLGEKRLSPLDSIVVLPDPALGDKIYGIVALSVGNVRYEPDYSSELATQLLMGSPVEILEKVSYWYRIITPEGYHAWITENSLKLMNEEEMKAWRGSDRIIITTHYTLFREKANLTSQILSDGVWGDIVELDGKQSGLYYKVILPKGQTAFIPKESATPLCSWLESRKPTPEKIIFTAKNFLGFPYLWAGTSIKGLDCSGFAKTTYFLNGIILRRDASQMAKHGVDVDITNGIGNLQKGDLIFFGRKATADRPERVTHVGIYIGDGIFIHSATWVHINSLLPEADNYYEGSTRLVRARRILGSQDSIPGIVSIARHPWYFNIEQK